MRTDPTRIQTAAQGANTLTLAVFLRAQRDILHAAGCKVTGRKLAEMARLAGLTFANEELRAIVKSWGTAVPQNATSEAEKCADGAVTAQKSLTNGAVTAQKNAPTCVRVARGMRSNNQDLEDQAESISYNLNPVANLEPRSCFANAQQRDNVNSSGIGQLIPLRGLDVPPSRRNRKLPGLEVPPPPENVAAGNLLVDVWNRLREKPRGMTQTRWRQANIRAAKDLLASGVTHEQALEAFERFEREHHGEQIRTIAFLQKAIDAQYADDRRRGVTDPDRPFGQSLYTTEEVLALP